VLNSAGEVSGKRWAFEWPRSWWMNLTFAAAIGVLYSFWVMGSGPINPHNINWLAPDAAQHQVAWELYRQDPKLHWPITFSDRIGVPEGESMALMDPDPLIAVLLKPFSPLLPEPFQYQGLEVVLSSTLQLFFAFLLFRLLLGPNPFGVLLPALFFLISPPLAWRFGAAHFALSNHWLLVAALLLLCAVQKNSPGSTLRFVGHAVILAGVAVAINPYLALQVLFLLTAGVVSLLWQRRLNVVRAAGVMAAVGATCFVVAAAFGLIISGGRGYAAGGYREFSLNTLALLDPQIYGALLFRQLPSPFEQYEGYNYLGLGVIVLALMGLPVFLAYRRNYAALRYRAIIPLFACCFALTLLALSTKITFGSATVVDLDPREHLTPYLSALRASGRLFWAPYYVILGTVLLAVSLSFSRAWATLLLSLALLLQLADTHGLRRWVRSANNQRYGSPLRSGVWSELGKFHKNLMIMPPWQCGSAASPGGADGYRIFGFLAAAQRMGINSYYAARYTEMNKEMQCGEAVSALSSKPLSPDSAYIVTPFLAQQIADGPTGPGKCYYLDQFILCSAKTTFGLTPVPPKPIERLQDKVLDAGFEDANLSAWSSYLDVSASPSTARARSGRQSLREADGAGSVYQDIAGLRAGHTYSITAWVAGPADATASAQITVYDLGSKLATSSSLYKPRESWQLVQHSVTVAAPGTLRIHLIRNQGSGTVFWDDVSIALER